ncbi:hypothetical protein DFJ63DRAFT_240389 [Scheffersomyces coipomensis]|uniref:uncharacterized protein n=1 Tax=Scheffersomyces coipomensis TaxID=1788519 RepID=UPI00315DDEA4
MGKQTVPEEYNRCKDKRISYLRNWFPTLFNKQIECATYNGYFIDVIIAYHNIILHELKISRESLDTDTRENNGSILDKRVETLEDSSDSEEHSPLDEDRKGNRTARALKFIKDPKERKKSGETSKVGLLKRAKQLAIIIGLSVTVKIYKQGKLITYYSKSGEQGNFVKSELQRLQAAVAKQLHRIKIQVGSESQSESQNLSQNLTEFSSSQFEKHNTSDVTADNIRAVENTSETNNTSNISTNTNDNSNFLNSSGTVEVIDQNETPNTANDINDSIKQDAASYDDDLSDWFAGVSGGGRGGNTDISEIDSNRDYQEEFDDNNSTLEQADISNQHEEHNPHGNLDIRQEKSSDVLHEDPKGIIIYEESASFFWEQLSPEIHFNFKDLTNDQREAFLEYINAATFESKVLEI